MDIGKKFTLGDQFSSASSSLTDTDNLKAASDMEETQFENQRRGNNKYEVDVILTEPTFRPIYLQVGVRRQQSLCSRHPGRGYYS